MAARAAERRLRALAGARPELGVGMLDREGRLVLLEGLAGTHLRDQLGQRATDVLRDERGPIVAEHVAAALAGEPRAFDLPSPAFGTVYRVELDARRGRGRR